MVAGDLALPSELDFYPDDLGRVHSQTSGSIGVHREQDLSAVPAVLSHRGVERVLGSEAGQRHGASGYPDASYRKTYNGRESGSPAAAGGGVARNGSEAGSYRGEADGGG